jgi:hypothetical protein
MIYHVFPIDQWQDFIVFPGGSKHQFVKHDATSVGPKTAQTAQPYMVIDIATKIVGIGH